MLYRCARSFYLCRSDRFAILLLNLSDQLKNTRTFFNRRIEFEDKLWHIAYSNAAGQLVAEKAASMSQALERLLLFLRGAHHAHKDFGVTEIAADLDPCDTGKADARIFEPGTHEIAKFFGEQFA